MVVYIALAVGVRAAAATATSWYTPLLGVTHGLALLGLGFGEHLWAKKLMPGGGRRPGPARRPSTSTERKPPARRWSTGRRDRHRPPAAAQGRAGAGCWRPVGAAGGRPARRPDQEAAQGRAVCRRFDTASTGKRRPAGPRRRHAVRPEDLSAGGHRRPCSPASRTGLTNKYADSAVPADPAAAGTPSRSERT